MTAELRKAVQRGLPKMNNKRKFIMEETRTYLNKRDKEEKLNRRNRQMEYSNELTDLRMGENESKKTKPKKCSLQG